MKEQNVALVLSGLPGAVSEVLNDCVLTFLNRARKVALPPLAREDIDAFVARAFQQLDIKVDDGQRAIAASEADFESDVCRTTLAALSDRDIDFLTCMAQDDRESRISKVAERMGVGNDYAQKYRRRLIDAGFIEPTRRGYVRFAVPYLSGYLRARDDW